MSTKLIIGSKEKEVTAADLGLRDYFLIRDELYVVIATEIPTGASDCIQAYDIASGHLSNVRKSKIVIRVSVINITYVIQSHLDAGTGEIPLDRRTDLSGAA